MALCQETAKVGEFHGPIAQRGNRYDRPLRWKAPAHRLIWAAAAAGAMLTLPPPAAHAQFLPPSDCLAAGQPLVRVPEIVAQNHKLRGIVLMSDEHQRMTFPNGCALQYVRVLRGLDAAPAVPWSKYPDPMPGPTLRARVGDIVELTFLNQVDPGNFPGSIDRGDTAGACDETSAGYPKIANDTFPNCFHGSSTGNIHYHGTHTNPGSTGDNVFVQIRPSPRLDGQPLVTGDSVKDSFDTFFKDCETNLDKNVLSEWPSTWDDLPADWRAKQRELLDALDKGTPPYSPPAKPEPQRLWPANAEALAKGHWPQFYVGAYPYCFRLPDYTSPGWPPVAPSVHDMQMGPPSQILRMGQSPGTHWYHAHKHGSTAIDVLNGMTGVFVIEGKYDDELNRFYGTPSLRDWARSQPVLVINQLDVTVSRFGGTGAGAQTPFSVNGRIQPKLTMRPGEVQLWRIANTGSRSGLFFVGFQASGAPADQPAPFQWKQLAQDGVQFAAVNYQNSDNSSFTMAAGNRVDLLVKAPANPTQQAQSYNVVVKSTVAGSTLQKQTQFTLMTVSVSPGGTATGPESQFMPAARMAASFPPFLSDITDSEVSGTKRIVFESKKPNAEMQHTIDGKQFDETLGEAVVLNKAEEWTIVNATDPAFVKVDHPFHIHLNPFQVTEVFDPNQQVTDSAGKLVDEYVFDKDAKIDAALQCRLDPDDPTTWKPCHAVKRSSLIWWDVFPIPLGKKVTAKTGSVLVPGYFKMRSRFVDFPGLYVMHCHILAHEDRGMMTTVEVVPAALSVRHH